MKLVLEIPDAVYDRVIDNVCIAYNYDPNSGLDKPSFVQQTFLNLMFSIVKSQEGDIAAKSARKVAEDSVDSQISVKSFIVDK